MSVLIKELIERELLVAEGIEKSIYSSLNEKSCITDPPFEIVPDVFSEPIQEFLSNIREIKDIDGILMWAKIYQAVWNSLQSFKRSFRDLLEIGGYSSKRSDQKTRRIIPLSKFLISGKGNCLEKSILAQLAFQDSEIESYLVIGSYGSRALPHFHGFNLLNIDNRINLMDIQNVKGPEMQRLSLRETMTRAFIVLIKEVGDDYKFDAVSEFEGKPIKRTYWFRKLKPIGLRCG